MKMNNDTDNNRNNGNGSINLDQPNTSGSGNTPYNPNIEEIKQRATQLYNEKKYHSAVGTYTLLIGLCPNEATFYSNRAACYMMLGDYVKALEDAKKSVEFNPMFIKGHCRVIKCAIILHRRLDIEISVAKLREIDPENEVLQYQVQKMQELLVHQQNEVNANASKDYVKALEHIEKCLEICPQFLDYKIKKADCLVNLRRFNEAETFSRAILREDPNNSDIHYVLGRCLYETDIETSIYHFKTAFRLDPDSGKNRQLYERGKTFLEKKMEANKAYKSQNFSQAYNLYYKLMLECIANSGMLITLFFNMAQASYKLGNLDRCRQECTSVLNLKPNHLKALMRRAQCYMDQKDFSKAIEDLEKALGIESSAELLRMLQEARKLSEALKNDFYTILGVERDASVEMITKAYKELTRIHHPDRHMNATNEEKKYHEMKCKEITRAYRLLMDQKPAKESNNTNGSQGPSSAPKPPPKAPNTDSNNNNGKPSSSGGTNKNSTGSQSSAGGTNTPKGQQHPSGGTNNNFSGPQSSTGAPNSSNGQQNQSGGTSTNSTNAQPSSGQQYPSGATNNNGPAPQQSAGGYNNYGEQQAPAGTSNGTATGQQFPSWMYEKLYSSGFPYYTFFMQQHPSGVPLVNPSGQQYSGGPSPHLNKNPPGAFNNTGNASQSSSGPPPHSNQQQPPPKNVNNNLNDPKSSTTTHNSKKNHKQKFSRGNWYYDDNDDWDEDDDWDDEDDWDEEEYAHQKPWQRRRGHRYRPYHYQRYCHYCDWYIRGKYNCCPYCGFNPR